MSGYTQLEENWDDEDYTHGSEQPSQQQTYQNGGGGGGGYNKDDSFNSKERSWRENGGKRRDKRDHRSRGVGGREYSNGHSRMDFKEEIEIRSDCIGLIIGRSGANIQRIQTDFNVHVDLDKGRGMVTVCGNTESSVKDAIGHIREQMDSASNRRSDRRDDRSRNKPYTSNERQDSLYDTLCPFEEELKGNKVEEEKPFELIDWAEFHRISDEVAAEKWAKMLPLTKNFYQESPEVSSLTTKEVARIRSENNDITVSRVFEQEDATLGENIPNPVWKFEQCFEAYPDLLGEIRKQGFAKPSPIQAQAWPILLKGEDLIGIAQTGTGKTLAFLLPAMIHTEYQSTPRGPKRGGANVLIMAPTRELALQIEKEVNKYSFRGMKAVCVYGGGNRRDQIDHVEKGAEIIIATPGRLNDLINNNVIDVKSVTYLVLDEADRMLDMGFEPQIRKTMLDIRPDRQTVMTSATWPPGVRRLAQSYMKNPIQVCVGSLDLAATHTVTQLIEIMSEEDKYPTIKNFVANMRKDDKIIIFCGRKNRADDLSSDLCLAGNYTTTLHGNREQYDREQAIADITSGEVRILIATDVASRGLDIEDITHVINYDFPRNIEEYVHRVGRTGRAGRHGTSISYVTREDWGVAKDLIGILQEAKQEVPDELHNMANRFKSMKERRANEAVGFGNRGGNRFGGGGGDRGGNRYGGRRNQY